MDLHTGDTEFVRIWRNKDLANHLWTPKSVCMFNHVGTDKCFDDISDITVFGSGKTEFTTSREFLILCRLDITTYPFDEQMCIIQLGNLHHFADFINFDVTTSEFELIRSFNNNEEWEILVLDASVDKRKIPDRRMKFLQ